MVGVLLILPTLVLVGVLVAGLLETRRMGRSAARLPLKDFRAGDLPMVCAVSGEPADVMVHIENDDSWFHRWWFLMFLLGPVGVISIVILALMSRRSIRISGLLPLTHAMVHARARAVSVAKRAWIVPVAGFASAVILLLLSQPIGANWLDVVAVGAIGVALVGGFVVAGASEWVVHIRGIELRLDESGEWVELKHVHPNFVAAAARQAERRLGTESVDGDR